MSTEIFFELQEQLAPVLRAGDTAGCERTVAERLSAMARTPFHVVLDLSITNPPTEVAAHFDGFFRQEPGLKIYRHPVDDILPTAAHTLDAMGEAIVAA